MLVGKDVPISATPISRTRTLAKVHCGIYEEADRQLSLDLIHMNITELEAEKKAKIYDNDRDDGSNKSTEMSKQKHTSQVLHPKSKRQPGHSKNPAVAMP